MNKTNGLRFDPARRDRLRSQARRRRLPPFKILRRLGLKKGDMFVDIGCGPGFFTLPASRIVGPRGKAVGLDVSPEMLADLKAESAKTRATNIRTARIGENGGGIPPGASLYFLSNVLHEVENKPRTLAALRRNMGPESRLAVLEYHKRKTRHGPPPSHRISLNRLRSLAGVAGFRLVAALDVNDEEYAVVLKKTVPEGKSARISRMPDTAHRRKP